MDNSGKARRVLAQAQRFMKQNRNKKARNKFELALKLDPLNANVWFEYGAFCAFNFGNNLDEACEKLEMAVELDPGHVFAAGMCGGWYADLGQHSKAITMYDIDIKHKSAKNECVAKIYQLRAFSFMKMRQFERAAKDYEQAVIGWSTLDDDAGSKFNQTLDSICQASALISSECYVKSFSVLEKVLLIYEYRPLSSQLQEAAYQVNQKFNSLTIDLGIVGANIGITLFLLGRYQESIDAFAMSYVMCIMEGDEFPGVRRVYADACAIYARKCQKQGNMKQALAEYKSSWEIDQKPKRVCVYCRKRYKSQKMLKTCGCCRKPSYCGTNCQELHWSVHKLVCKSVIP